MELEPTIPVSAAERETAGRLIDAAATGLVVIHPGATDPRRRWPPERFAEVAARLADTGVQVLVVGDASEQELADRVVAGAQGQASAGAQHLVASLAGRLSLAQLMGLLARADVVLGNDSGPRHLAQAAGTRTVAVFWVGNVVNGAPLARGRHRVHMSWTTRCPVCGADCTTIEGSARCEHDVSFVADVPVPPVYADVRRLLTDAVSASSVP